MKIYPVELGEVRREETSLGRVLANPTLHEELSGARKRRIWIALQKDTTREVLEGWQALEGWLP